MKTQLQLRICRRAGLSMLCLMATMLADSLASRPLFGQTPGVFDVTTSETEDAESDLPVSPRGDTAVPPVGAFTEVVDVRVINVDVVVTNRAGVPVAGLLPEDFELEVDGDVMPISNFYAEASGQVRETLGQRASAASSEFQPESALSQATARPAHVVILIDHSGLKANTRKRALEGVREAVDGLSPNDLVAVVGIEGRLVFYSDFLYDRGALGRILEEVTQVSLRTDILETERRQIFGELARGMSGGIQQQASLAESDAIISRIRAYAAERYASGVRSLQQIETVVSTLAGLSGRKMLIYVGEGIPNRPGEGLYTEWINRFGAGAPNAEIGMRRFDFSTDYSRTVGRYELEAPMRQLATAANRAGVTLYSVDAEGSHSGEIRSALTEQGAMSEALSIIDENYREPLEYASKATGGRLLQSSGMLAERLGRLVDDFDTFYSLGFTAPDDWDNGSDHRIKVNVRGRGLLARHREQVRLPAPDEREAGATQAALRYQTVGNPLGFRAVPGTPVSRTDGTVALPIDLEIPIDKLGFVPAVGEAQTASLSIYVSTKDANGDATRVQKVPFHLPPIPNDVMMHVRSESARYPLPVVLRPGDQQVAIGIRDNVSGGFSAVRVDVSRFSGKL